MDCCFLRFGQFLWVSPLLTAVFCFFSTQRLEAVRNRFYDEGNAIAIKEMHDSVDDLRHEVHNHESEIRMFDEKLKNLDTIIDSLRDQLNDTSQAHKEQLKGNAVSLEAKITSLETISKGLVSDLRQFKTHANEVSGTLTQQKQKIADLEKIIEQQNQNIDHLQEALKVLMDALQVKDPPATSGKNHTDATSTGNERLTYKVKSGDSLEKIARHHQTTVQALKELNNLSHDRIVIGQTLQIPEK